MKYIREVRNKYCDNIEEKHYFSKVSLINTQKHFK